MAEKYVATTEYGIMRYGAALELYRTTDMMVKEICEQTNTPVTAFRAYLWRNHRELMFARHGIEISPGEAAKVRLRKKSGQTAAAYAKYKDAIRACDDAAYIEFNVSQIARLFELNPSALGNQLRNHYPEILERREKERHRLGVNDNLHRGVKSWCKEQYAEAVEHLRITKDTIRQTADLYGLSSSGLREHLLYYYKDLIRARANKRERAKTNKIRGELTGNGRKHEPMPESEKKYRTTAMTQEEICAAIGVTVMGLRHHLRLWNKELMEERHDVDGRGEGTRPTGTKCYLKSTAAKYAGAIERLKATGSPMAEVAKEFGLNPDVFRKYLHEHEPELAATLGRTKLSNGRSVLARSAEKYDEAVRLYETTTETLKSIARRLGLQYKSVGGFVRRNHPEAIAAHDRLLEQEKRLQEQKESQSCEKEQTETTVSVQEEETKEKEHILQVLKQTGGHKRNAAKLLGIGKSTLYNKLRKFNLSE